MTFLVPKPVLSQIALDEIPELPALLMRSNSFSLVLGSLTPSRKPDPSRIELQQGQRVRLCPTNDPFPGF